jgi:UDP-N-acetylmuramate dehydrogenase
LSESLGIPRARKALAEKALERACPGGIRQDVPMARYTTIGAGGPARYFAEPGSVREVVSLVRTALACGIDYIAVGKGSNLLVRDGGFDGLVIHIGRGLSNFAIRKRTAMAEAGMSFTQLGKVLSREGRPGFEFAVGIPGSVGGAVRMNAGAWGASVSQVLRTARTVDATGRVVTLKAADLGFAYRTSLLPVRSIVLSALFECPPGEIDNEKLELSMTRAKTQPLSQKSFGSAFKNPPGGYAGRMIEECGLKGTRRGGVEVSEKHANFLVNVGEGTKANDIEDLMAWIVEKVEAKFKVTLIPEVIIIGNR